MQSRSWFYWQWFATSGAKLKYVANIIYNHMMKNNILKAGLQCFELWKHIEQSNFWEKLGRTLLLLPSLGCVWINSSLASQTLQASTSSYRSEGFWKALYFITISDRHWGVTCWWSSVSIKYWTLRSQDGNISSKHSTVTAGFLVVPSRGCPLGEE